MLTEESRKKLNSAVSEYKNGRLEAFNAIFDLTNDIVFRACMNITGDFHAAEDIMQEVYMSVSKALTGFREDASFLTWIYRIALNKSLSAVKKRKEAVISSDEFPEIPVEDGDVDNTEHDEELKGLRECIHKLDPSFRTIIVMRDIEGLSYEEIAEVEEVPVGTVRSRLHRGRNLVKDCFVKRQD